ncbi:uncharacterized protein LOC117176700 [Belonocnema kinseyi]|uniref:uncharacterized protein LOC117176700 n=1 Tax=Belonocnema kinseyi TaxID=2817044 RepID=UPI00143DA010|nr:uncharacterized protein LOC117176700 [Belonocnema kinseyi]
MRDPFATGIRDESTRFEFFKSKEITFDQALEEALAREEATQNSVGAAQTLVSRSHKQESFALGQKRQNKNQKKQSSSEVKCYCCGKAGHETNECKYRDRKCDFCHRKGHLERACIRKMKLSNKFLEENSSSSSSESEEEISDQGSGSGPSRSSNFIDFHNINSEKQKLTVIRIKRYGGKSVAYGRFHGATSKKGEAQAQHIDTILEIASSCKRLYVIESEFSEFSYLE